VEGFREMKRLSSVYLPLAVGAALTLVLAGNGCTTHGEGGRCDPLNKNSSGGFADCDSNLICTPGSDLSLPEGGTVSGNICCPQDRSKATTDICRGSPITPGSDASIPEGGFESGTDATSDGPPSDAPVSDAPVSDAPAETSTDAAGD
jgi:hypothetical protein